jgi:hypothetical protein
MQSFISACRAANNSEHRHKIPQKFPMFESPKLPKTHDLFSSFMACARDVSTSIRLAFLGLLLPWPCRTLPQVRVVEKLSKEYEEEDVDGQRHRGLVVGQGAVEAKHFVIDGSYNQNCPGYHLQDLKTKKLENKVIDVARI